MTGAGRPGDTLPRALAEAAAALRRGALPEVEEAGRRVLALDPGHPQALELLGQAALARGRGGEAAALFETALRRDPRHASLRCNLAFAHRLAGRPAEAVREAAEAARLDPKLTAAHTVLGTTLVDLGRAAEAIQPLERALELAPGLDRAVLALAAALRALGRHGEAQARLEQAVAANPRLADAWAALGWIHAEARRSEDAVRCFRTSLVVRRASLWWPGGGVAAAPPRPATAANLLKLDHDIEQLSYLAERGLLPEAVAATIDGHRALRQRIASAHGSENLLLSRAELGPLAEVFSRVVHFRETPDDDAPVLSDAWDRARVEAAYAVPPGICWVDGLLAPRAFDELRAFCLESTIWNDVAHNFRAGGVARAYLGTYAADGFCAPILFRIAEELTRALPAIFKDHRLRQMWAYKYQAETAGIDLHGDDAAVNVNFWITPDEANLDPESGGLVLHPVEAPADWSFADMNRHPERIQEFVRGSGIAPVNVPYRRNRAVIFNSDLFHATAPLSFRPGYENRRINVTMLFGRRGDA